MMKIYNLSIESRSKKTIPRRRDMETWEDDENSRKLRYFFYINKENENNFFFALVASNSERKGKKFQGIFLKILNMQGN